MKSTLIIFALLAGFSHEVTGQEERKNTIHLEFYSPVRMTSMGEFYNDDWDFLPKPSSIPLETEFTRHYFSNAFGLSYERSMANSLILKARLGITVRRLKESFFADYHHQQDEGSDNYITDNEFNYSQKHINGFVGLAKRIPLFKKISVDLGADLAYALYLKGTSGSYGYTEEFNDDGALIFTHEVWNTSTTGSAHLFGMGPHIDFLWKPTNRLTIAAGVQIYFMYMASKEPRMFSYKRITTDFQNSYVDQFSIEYTQHNKIGQFGWTTFSPVIRLGYSF